MPDDQYGPRVLTRTAEEAALQAVLLDMDGTLVDTEGFWWDVEKEVFAGLGHPLEESWRDVVVGGPMTRSAGYLIDATGADIRLDELTVLLNDGFEARIGRGVPLMPGAERLLAELAVYEVPTALVSASHRRIIDRVLESVGRHHFALTVAGDESPGRSPPEPYLTAAAGFGADPGAARSSRTPPPAWPPPRPQAAGWSPCRPSRPSPRLPGAWSSAPSKRSTSPSCAG